MKNDIVDTVVHSPNLTTLTAALKAAGLVETLQGDGPFTVFAPTDDAFDKLPSGTVSTLTKPENKSKLTSILTYHVVQGKLSAADIAAKAGSSGKAMMKTVEGDDLTFAKDKNGKWCVMDGKGDKAMITDADMMESNGVIHVIDTVLMPH